MVLKLEWPVGNRDSIHVCIDYIDKPAESDRRCVCTSTLHFESFMLTINKFCLMKGYKREKIIVSL